MATELAYAASLAQQQQQQQQTKQTKQQTNRGGGKKSTTGTVVPVGALLRLRELVAQQDVYLSSFAAFATNPYVEAFDHLKAMPCVRDAVRMRDVFLRRLADLESDLGQGAFFDAADDDQDPERRLHPLMMATTGPLSSSSTKHHQHHGGGFGEDDDDAPNDSSSSSASYVRFSPEEWWRNQTCRIDHVHRVSELIAHAIVDHAEDSRQALRIRGVRLAAPLLACVLLTVLVAAHAVRAFLRYKTKTEKRVLRLESRRLRYKDLLRRWAPLSWGIIDEDDDDSGGSASPTASNGEGNHSPTSGSNDDYDFTPARTERKRI
mmetsp:Transcript_27246/g.88053  ORF Transcript_27246/g.88053 Transcript_27246/m.88053 type:complete len:320 (+) Transcript_27246:3-962(+)